MITILSSFYRFNRSISRPLRKWHQQGSISTDLDTLRYRWHYLLANRSFSSSKWHSSKQNNNRIVERWRVCTGREEDKEKGEMIMRGVRRKWCNWIRGKEGRRRSKAILSASVTDSPQHHILKIYYKSRKSNHLTTTCKSKMNIFCIKSCNIIIFWRTFLITVNLTLLPVWERVQLYVLHQHLLLPLEGKKSPSRIESDHRMPNYPLNKIEWRGKKWGCL